MHRCLGDGTLRLGRRDSGPLALTVLGRGHHYEGEEYVMAHVRADEGRRSGCRVERRGRGIAANVTTASTRNEEGGLPDAGASEVRPLPALRAKLTQEAAVVRPRPLFNEAPFVVACSPRQEADHTAVDPIAEVYSMIG
jgi:hypothetical protein